VDLNKLEFENAKRLDSCTVRIEFKLAADCPAFIKALERMKAQGKK